MIILFNCVRTKSLLKKHGSTDYLNIVAPVVSDKEKSLIIKLNEFEKTIELAAHNYSPAIMANYCYDLAKEYSQFYASHYILSENSDQLKLFRLNLTAQVGRVLEKGLLLIGIEVPNRMWFLFFGKLSCLKWNVFQFFYNVPYGPAMLSDVNPVGGLHGGVYIGQHCWLSAGIESHTQFVVKSDTLEKNN